MQRTLSAKWTLFYSKRYLRSKHFSLVENWTLSKLLQLAYCLLALHERKYICSVRCCVKEASTSTCPRLSDLFWFTRSGTQDMWTSTWKIHIVLQYWRKCPRNSPARAILTSQELTSVLLLPLGLTDLWRRDSAEIHTPYTPWELDDHGTTHFERIEMNLFLLAGEWFLCWANQV